MAHRYVNIFVTDSKNHKILIGLKYSDDLTECTWRVHHDDTGWLAVTEGTVFFQKSKKNLYLLGSEKSWGILLNNYTPWGGESYGTVLQPWVLAFESGEIVWATPQGVVRL